ncbi:MAG: hypothetical protein GWN71_10530, partial [Gammaproteobacteria bacterium]|nr:hypothetical protein [Gemmatimonadota bacterium]NIU73998.1 hypothetical protein [Gammaproteobacteria bacterium]
SERARELYGQARRILEDERDIWTGLDGAIAVLERADSLLQEAERADPDWPDATVLRAEVWRQRAREAASPGENYEPAAT